MPMKGKEKRETRENCSPTYVRLQTKRQKRGLGYAREKRGEGGGGGRRIGERIPFLSLPLSHLKNLSWRERGKKREKRDRRVV